MVGQCACSGVTVDRGTVHRHRPGAIPKSSAFQCGEVAIHRSAGDGGATWAGDVHSTAIPGIAACAVHVQHDVGKHDAGASGILLDTSAGAHRAIAGDAAVAHRKHAGGIVEDATTAARRAICHVRHHRGSVADGHCAGLVVDTTTTIRCCWAHCRVGTHPGANKCQTAAADVDASAPHAGDARRDGRAGQGKCGVVHHERPTFCCTEAHGQLHPIDVHHASIGDVEHAEHTTTADDRIRSVVARDGERNADRDLARSENDRASVGGGIEDDDVTADGDRNGFSQRPRPVVVGIGDR